MVNCPVCSSRVFLKICEIRFLEIVGVIEEYSQSIFACQRCGHVYVGNPLDDEIISNYYKNMSKYEGVMASGIVDSSKEKMSLRQMEFIGAGSRAIRSVLEIGASTGFNLNEYKKKGLRVFGVEPSSNNQKFAKENYDVDLFSGTFLEYLSQGECELFDLVILSHVLEHICDINQFVECLAKVNNKYIFLEVPSVESVPLGEPYGLFFYEHLHYFTVDALVRLMANAEYSPVKISIEFNLEGASPGYPVICSMWEKSSNRVDVRSPVRGREILEHYIVECQRRFIRIGDIVNSLTDEMKIAVWGVGGHTSRLMGMTNLMNFNVVKFYDSDPKKYEFKIAGKSIAKYSFSDIEDGIINTVLISTFSGEQAIKKILKESAPDLNVICLYS